MPENWQAKSRLGHKSLAGQQLETGAGRIGSALVIAGDDNAKTGFGDPDLSRTEDMAGGMKRHFDVAKAQALAISQRLCRAGEIFAETKAHDVQRLSRRQHRAMTGAGVIGMGVGDHGARDRPRRIDMKISGRAVKPCRRVRQHIGGCGLERQAGLPQAI